MHSFQAHAFLIQLHTPTAQVIGRWPKCESGNSIPTVMHRHTNIENSEEQSKYRRQGGNASSSAKTSAPNFC